MKRGLWCYYVWEWKWKGGTREDFAVTMILNGSGRVEHETDFDNKR